MTFTDYTKATIARQNQNEYFKYRSRDDRLGYAEVSKLEEGQEVTRVFLQVEGNEKLTIPLSTAAGDRVKEPQAVKSTGSWMMGKRR